MKISFVVPIGDIINEFAQQFRLADFMNEKKGPHARKEFADGLYKILSTRREKSDV